MSKNQRSVRGCDGTEWRRSYESISRTTRLIYILFDASPKNRTFFHLVLLYLWRQEVLTTPAEFHSIHNNVKFTEHFGSPSKFLFEARSCVMCIVYEWINSLLSVLVEVGACAVLCVWQMPAITIVVTRNHQVTKWCVAHCTVCTLDLWPINSMSMSSWSRLKRNICVHLASNHLFIQLRSRADC